MLPWYMHECDRCSRGHTYLELSKTNKELVAGGMVVFGTSIFISAAIETATATATYICPAKYTTSQTQNA
jgi:hypothetical protein